MIAQKIGINFYLFEIDITESKIYHNRQAIVNYGQNVLGGEKMKAKKLLAILLSCLLYTSQHQRQVNGLV